MLTITCAWNITPAKHVKQKRLPKAANKSYFFFHLSNTKAVIPVRRAVKLSATHV